jgi:predicted NAD/FAD-binding protein
MVNSATWCCCVKEFRQRNLRLFIVLHRARGRDQLFDRGVVRVSAGQADTVKRLLLALGNTAKLAGTIATTNLIDS